MSTRAVRVPLRPEQADLLLRLQRERDDAVRAFESAVNVAVAGAVSEPFVEYTIERRAFVAFVPEPPAREE